MNITFFVGNGFDLNLGLYTRYSEFYPEFIKNAHASNIIKEWLEDAKSNNKEYQIWADLEEALGKDLSKVKEGEVEKLLDDKLELENLLLDYLENEQDRLKINDNEKEIAKEFARSLIEFCSDLSEVGKDSIEQTFDVYAAEDFKYCFIVYNYTNSLDRMIEITKNLKAPITTHKSRSGTRHNLLDKILHIHGTTNGEIILGVNDADQINNPVLKNNLNILNAFVKKNLNDVIGQKKVERARKIIDGSHIICIFGMSIGNTDKMWWEEIVEWLKKSKNNKLIIYVHSSENNSRRNMPLEVHRLNKETKDKLLERGGMETDGSEYEEVSSRIFIPYKSDIFKFEGLVLKEDNSDGVE